MSDVTPTYNWAPFKAGTVWRRTIFVKDDAGNPKDLEGYTAKMHIRPGLEGKLAKELATGGNGITITAADGRIDIELTGEETMALHGLIQKGVYDLFLYASSGEATCLLKGTIEVEGAVTR